MSKHIKDYIDSKRGVWSDTTIRSESYRLKGLEDRGLLKLTLTGAELLKQLKDSDLKPYAQKTALVRIADYRSFHNGNDTLKTYISKDARNALRSTAYRPDRNVGVDLQDIKDRISRVDDLEARAALYALLSSGRRASELSSTTSDGTIIGKGNKARALYGAAPAATVSTVSYARIYRAARSVGLKPHTLRKAAATALVRAGFKAPELMEVMGWSSMQTAASYLQPIEQEELNNKVKAILG